MKTAMQQTSLLAYDQFKSMGQHQSMCYRVIERMGAACNLDIAHQLQWDINRVTPRVKELRETGFVEEAYRDLNPETNRKVIYWKIKEYR